jgi:hypothetical protein
MLDRRLSRREFLRGLAYAAGISFAGVAASACGPLIGASADLQYLSPDRRRRAVSLIRGQIPASWKSLTADALMPLLEQEIASTVLPEVSSILGGDAQDISSRLEYDADESRLLALVKGYGESNSTLAAQVSNQSVGITVSRFSESEPVPDKRIAINVQKIRELAQTDLAKTQVSDERDSSAKLNALIVQWVVDAVIHETTHYIMEIDRLPQDGDLHRLQSMYAGGAIGTVEFQKLLYYEGVQIAFISAGGYKYYLNKALTEIVRSYVMKRLLAELEAGLANPPVRFHDTVYLVDSATNQVVDYLHSEIGLVTPAPPLAVFKNDLLRLIDFYQDPPTISGQVSAQKVHLLDTDFVRIFGLMESLYASISSAVGESGGRETVPNEMTDRAKLEIGKIVAEARLRA